VRSISSLVIRPNASLQLLPEAAAERSKAEQLSCLSRGHGLLGAQPLRRWPWGVVFPPGVQARQPRAQTGRQRHLRRLTSGPQALVERVAHGSLPDRHAGPHRPSGPPVRTASPSRPTAAAGAAIPVQGGHPDQGGPSVATQRAPRRPVAPARAGTDGATPRDAARAATTARWSSPVASRTSSVGGSACSRATRAARRGAAWATAQRSLGGRRATARRAVAPSRPTKSCPADLTTPHRPDRAGGGLSGSGPRCGLAEVRTTPAPLRSRRT
jgi:hypothetical protein